MSTSTPPKENGSGEPVKPTLLAFHGSGSNATVHTVQLARLMRAISPYFKVESLEAPFPSPAGPGVLPFFDGCGPFKRWLPPSEKVSLEIMRSGQSTNALAPEVEDLVRSTVQKIRAEGGRVVGLIGFSQGTKVVAGLLKGVEVRRALGTQADGGEELAWLDFDFALSVCGSYPPPLIPGSVVDLVGRSGLSDVERKQLLDAKIAVPTFHVQGKQDEWHWAGQGLIEGYYDVAEGKSEVMQWDMGHHYPVPPEDSESIRDWMVEVLEKIEGDVQVQR
ncbi:citrinin biosynthesis oxidoreductase-like protein CtnB [Cucurbitaria berberidis CBS 394.84]|uniref:Citrinin biosynthesis oxidoreductase-like protein CtnB n=1 Tax=Cucurbitaria berberidis CBS 394.84 TaxID=1168544 RepID=A0A9P4GBW7_9PLEO|nr:citrinin biosynthesis oxidoreductase-like protein CtnB [Cucurbitaria berberidis CBS 394.84]KAF1843018.1 citrinin biosynthesis oxidoreductase-like protein CtnB [Cucurbitaria berberidis CBS 394.84]